MLTVGQEFPPYRYTVAPTKAEEFVRAIGDRLYPAEGGWLAPIGLVFIVSAQDWARIFAEVAAPWDKLLFARLSLRYHRPLLTGVRLIGRTRLTSYWEVGREPYGFLAFETTYHDEPAQLALSEQSTIAVRGGLPLPAGPRPEPPREVQASASTIELPPYERRITRLDMAYMAVATEDPNPIHLEDDVARHAGYPGVIAHGPLAIGCAGAMLARWAGSPAAIRELTVRLLAPSFPGETLRASGRVASQADEGRVVALMVAANERVVLRGTALVAQA